MRGDRHDQNGPFLAAEALRLGLEPERITIVGDGPDDLARALAQGFEADLCLVSGGLGPTHDDRTVEMVARVADRALVVDEDLEREIEAVSRMVADRLGRPYTDFETGVRKQATLPAGAVSLGLAGTAPGLVLETDSGHAVVVLPGPPRELRRLWPRALESEPVRRVVDRAPALGRRVLRFFGTPESAVAKALEEAGGDGAGVEATICAREFEIHVDLVVEPGAERRADELAGSLRAALGRHLFSEDERAIAEIVLELCRERGMTLATAESCTGGLVSARLTAVPGASEVFKGGVVSYANEVKEERARRAPRDPRATRCGVGRGREGDGRGRTRPAARRRRRLGDRRRRVRTAAPTRSRSASCSSTRSGRVGRRPAAPSFPGDREMIRGRATAAALHLVRRLLQNRHTPA